MNYSKVLITKALIRIFKRPNPNYLFFMGRPENRLTVKGGAFTVRSRFIHWKQWEWLGNKRRRRR